MSLAVAAPAQAGPLVASASGCVDGALERPFMPWLDPANYVLAPDGTMEAGAAGWVLNGAETVSGNEPFYVHGAGESTALRVGDGGDATSPAMCVGVEHPTLRLFARSGGGLGSRLAVDVLFEDAAGEVQSVRIGSVSGDGSWAPTPAMPILVNLLPLLPGERTAVAFRFSAAGGAWTIDDVYVDPYCRC